MSAYDGPTISCLAFNTDADCETGAPQLEVILLATTTTTATTITTMNSAAYCNAYQLDDAINGDTCDYVAVAVAIAKNGGFSKTREKTEIICNMLRVGFKLEDIFKA
eukprot:gene17651-33352_t